MDTSMQTALIIGYIIVAIGFGIWFYYLFKYTEWD